VAVIGELLLAWQPSCAHVLCEVVRRPAAQKLSGAGGVFEFCRGAFGVRSRKSLRRHAFNFAGTAGVPHIGAKPSYFARSIRETCRELQVEGGTQARKTRRIYVHFCALGELFPGAGFTTEIGLISD
jgi:hypothetical protein